MLTFNLLRVFWNENSIVYLKLTHFHLSMMEKF